MSSTGLELSIVVPTYNEKGNVIELVRRLEDALKGLAWEVLFLDDETPDQTHEVVRRIGRTQRHVRCVQRIGKRGLSSACIDGMLSSSATYLVG